LIELLVVIAILVLLVSILMPALAGAKQLAKATACMTNLKNQGHAFYFFAEDHEQTVPTCFIYAMPEGLGRYLHQPYQTLVDGAPDNGFKGYGGQGGNYHDPAKGITYAPQFVCPSVAKPEGDNDDPMGSVTNSAYIHYALGMWKTFYWFSSLDGNPLRDQWGGRRVDMRQFDDLRMFLGAPDDTISEFTHSRNFFAGGGTTNNRPPSRFVLTADDSPYWYLNGTRDENGTPIGTVRYRHKDKANTLLLDGSVRPVWLIDAYGFEVLKF